MNNKIKYLEYIPLWGSIILLIILYIKDIKTNDRLTKEFIKLFFLTGLVGGISVFIIKLLLIYLSSLFNNLSFLKDYGFLIAFIIGGYIMNMFLFSLYKKMN